MRNRLNTNLASEFLVASNLWRLGYDVALTLGHTKEIDILARKGGHLITVDVKGTARPPFLLQLGARYPPHFFYVFVYWGGWDKFHDPKHSPRCYVVPPEGVKRIARRVRRLGSSVQIDPKKFSEYENKWEYLR